MVPIDPHNIPHTLYSHPTALPLPLTTLPHIIPLCPA